MYCVQEALKKTLPLSTKLKYSFCAASLCSILGVPCSPLPPRPPISMLGDVGWFLFFVLVRAVLRNDAPNIEIGGRGGRKKVATRGSQNHT